MALSSAAGDRLAAGEPAIAQEEFAEWLCQLVGEAEDGGLGLPEMIEVLRDQAEAMRIAHEE